MLKNTAGQIVGAQMTNVADGLPFTGVVSVYVTGNGGVQAIGSVAAGVCTHEGRGFHSYTPAQAETNYDHVAWTFEGTGAIRVTVQTYPAIAIGASSSVVVVASATVTTASFPATLNIGDSYEAGNALRLYLRDENNAPVSAAIGRNFTDADFAPTVTIAPGPGDRGKVVATVTYVVPGGAAENYLKVEIPMSQSRRAVEGVSTVQCVLAWGTTVRKTLITTTTEWLQKL